MQEIVSFIDMMAMNVLQTLPDAAFSLKKISKKKKSNIVSELLIQVEDHRTATHFFLIIITFALFSFLSFCIPPSLSPLRISRLLKYRKWFLSNH